MEETEFQIKSELSDHYFNILKPSYLLFFIESINFYASH